MTIERIVHYSTPTSRSCLLWHRARTSIGASARHGGELRGAFQTYCNVAEFGEDLKVASRAAAKIEYSERPFTLDVLQDRCDVLADVMIASAFPEILGMPVVELQRHVGDFVQVLRIQFHVRWTRSLFARPAEMRMQNP